MTQPILIGIHGVKQSGKGTAFQFINDWARSFGLTAVERGFADKPKWWFARQFFPDISRADAVKWVDKYKESGKFVTVPPEGPHHPEDMALGVPFRQAMAQFATEGGRELMGPDVWVDALIPMNPDYLAEFYVDGNPPDIAVITDVRFPNEVDQIEKHGGHLWKIHRQAAIDRVIAEARAQGRKIHASERGLPDGQFDEVLDNNSTLVAFRHQVEKEMMQIMRVAR